MNFSYHLIIQRIAKLKDSSCFKEQLRTEYYYFFLCLDFLFALGSFGSLVWGLFLHLPWNKFCKWVWEESAGLSQQVCASREQILVSVHNLVFLELQRPQPRSLTKAVYYLVLPLLVPGSQNQGVYRGESPNSGLPQSNLPAVQEDLLENEMATHYSILARKIPLTEEPRELQSMGLQRLRCYSAKFYPDISVTSGSTSFRRPPTLTHNSNTHFSKTGVPLSLNSQSMDYFCHSRQHLTENPLALYSVSLLINIFPDQSINFYRSMTMTLNSFEWQRIQLKTRQILVD